MYTVVIRYSCSTPRINEHKFCTPPRPRIPSALLLALNNLSSSNFPPPPPPPSPCRFSPLDFIFLYLYHIFTSAPGIPTYNEHSVPSCNTVLRSENPLPSLSSVGGSRGAPHERWSGEGTSGARCTLAAPSGGGRGERVDLLINSLSLSLFLSLSRSLALSLARSLSLHRSHQEPGLIGPADRAGLTGDFFTSTCADSLLAGCTQVE